MRGAYRLRESADPACCRTIGPMTAERAMHAIDELQGQLALVEADVVRDRECVGPQIAPLRALRLEAGARGELQHELERQTRARVDCGRGAHGLLRAPARPR